MTEPDWEKFKAEWRAHFGERRAVLPFVEREVVMVNAPVPWDEMSERERDAFVAEKAMGWERHDFVVADVSPPDGVMTVDVGAPHYWTTPDGKNRYLRTPWPLSKDQEIPHYTTDYNACRLVENEIERRGMQERYAEALVNIIDPDGAGVYSSAIEVDQYTSPHNTGALFIWAIAHATSDQRCRAALRAMGVEV